MVSASSEKCRRRKPHSRSKTGCVSCRSRHIKCGEQRPVCSNCMSSRISCTYPPPPVPVRELRKIQRSGLLPGQQPLWHVTEAPLDRAVTAVTPIFKPVGGAVDPFGSLAVDTPLRTMELLHYYVQCGNRMSSRASKQIVGVVGQDPTALRNTFLIVSLHYAWTCGSLKDFTPTYLLHKHEGLQTVGKLLGSARTERSLAKVVQGITTQCFVECALGNFDIARIHLQGLTSLVDVAMPDFCRPALPEGELAVRYVLLTLTFVLGLMARIADAGDARIKHVNRSPRSDSATTYSVIRKGHAGEVGGLQNRLKALLLIPYFFALPTPDTHLRPIDANDLVYSLADLTAKSEERLFPREGFEPNDFWSEGTSTTLFLQMFEGHIASMMTTWNPKSLDSRDRPPLKSAWSPLIAAATLYFGCILQMWDPSSARDIKIQRLLVQLVREDVIKTRTWLREWDERHRQLWLWKVFVAALSFRIRPSVDDDEDLLRLREEMDECIRAWAEVTGIRMWAQARQCLVEIAWPRYKFLETEAQCTWRSSYL